MYRYALIGVTAVLMAGCATDITTPDARRNQLSQFARVATTFSFAGRCETSFVFTGPTTIEIASVCQMRGIGRVTGVAQQALDFSHVAHTGLIGITNTGIYTAPNGDQLFATFVGTGSQTGLTVSFSGIETFTGGTGRFSNASGSVDAIGAADIATSTGYFTTTER